MILKSLSYLIPIFELGFPLYLVYRIWISDFSVKATWLIWMTYSVLAIAVLFIIARWDMAGYGLRYWLNGGCLLALAGSYMKVKKNPFYEEQGGLSWHWGLFAEGVLLIIGIGWAVMGMSPTTETVNLEYPLHGGSYYVAQGGGTPIINYHGAAAHQQMYALDINKLNRWGFRADGIAPPKPEQYAVFGDTVYSPISGMVVDIKSDLPDQHPPERLPSEPAGNHIWIKQDSLYLLLAHLKHESLRVNIGERIQAGQPVARVGNTGNTTEPHLHVHAVTFPATGHPGADSLLYGGTPVPLTFEGRFLTRNSRF